MMVCGGAPENVVRMTLQHNKGLWTAQKLDRDLSGSPKDTSPFYTSLVVSTASEHKD